MLATPLRPPPPLASIHDGAKAIDQGGRPDLSRFQARDGTWLAYRLYPAENGATERLAYLAHGSSSSSAEINVLAHALARSGVTAVAIEARGHGASGMRGDVGYAGQIDDDLADLQAELRKTHPDARSTLIGFSAGGGFALRVAGGPRRGDFDQYILLAPFLGYFAPTNRPNEGAGRWTSSDIPRIVALKGLSALGVDWLQSLPVVDFANPPGLRYATSQYSYRLLVSYGPPTDWRAAFRATAGRIEVIDGENDELMDAPAYKTHLEPLGAKVTVLPGVDHIGVVYQPSAVAAIVAAVKASTLPPGGRSDPASPKS